MKSSSLKMIDAGIADPRVYRDALIHDWFLPESMTKHLKVYILTETTPAQLFFNTRDGELKVKDKTYSLIWLNSPATVREARLVLVSLRFCKYLNRGYALVKLLQDPDNHEFSKLEY